MTHSFTIPGIPGIQGRPRRGKYGQFYDPSAKEKKVLGYQLLAARKALRFDVIAGEIGLWISFYGCGGRCDLDNLIKFFSDAANGVLWEDDRQVVQINAYMFRRDKEPRTAVDLMELGK